MQTGWFQHTRRVTVYRYSNSALKECQLPYSAKNRIQSRCRKQKGYCHQCCKWKNTLDNLFVKSHWRSIETPMTRWALHKPKSDDYYVELRSSRSPKGLTSNFGRCLELQCNYFSAAFSCVHFNSVVWCKMCMILGFCFYMSPDVGIFFVSEIVFTATGHGLQFLCPAGLNYYFISSLSSS